MDEYAFHTTRDLMLAAGEQVQESRYDWGCFGSWTITVNRLPRRRVVWDGKEGKLYVQQETDRMFAGLTEWDDIWVAAEQEEQTPHHAVERLRELKN